MNVQGIITRNSPYDVKDTVDRLIKFIENTGAIVYNRINQQSEVIHAGMNIPPLEFILFGNPKKGGAIMAFNPVAALDLPLKLVVWEGADHSVKVCYNDPFYIQQRYSLPEELAAPLNLMPLIDKALA